MDDHERYLRHRKPRFCIECEEDLIRSARPFPGVGRVVVIRCPKWNGEPSKHDYYRWVEEMPDDSGIAPD